MRRQGRVIERVRTGMRDAGQGQEQGLFFSTVFRLSRMMPLACPSLAERTCRHVSKSTPMTFWRLAGSTTMSRISFRVRRPARIGWPRASGTPLPESFQVILADNGPWIIRAGLWSGIRVARRWNRAINSPIAGVLLPVMADERSGIGSGRRACRACDLLAGAKLLRFQSGSRNPPRNSAAAMSRGSSMPAPRTMPR